MGYLILIVLMCASVQSQWHCIPCALGGLQSSPQCAVDTTFWPESTPLTKTELDIRTSGHVFTQESANLFDLRYLGLMALIIVVYIMYVLYLRTICSLPWSEASIHAFIQLATFFRGVATNNARLEVTCCPHVYQVCIETGICLRSIRPVPPPGAGGLGATDRSVLEDEETLL
jgi:hypothetical protein